MSTRRRPFSGFSVGFPTLAAVALVGAGLAAACSPSAGADDSSGAAATAGSDWWASEREAKTADYANYLTTHATDYEFFAHQPVGSTSAEFIPFILARLFPELLTDSSSGAFGLLKERTVGVGDLQAASALVPLGFVRTDTSKSGVSYLARSCGGCHTGRVEVDGKVVVFPGMPNTELRLHESLGALYGSVVRLFADTDASKKEILARLAGKSVTDIFGAGADATAGQAELDSFTQNLDKHLGTMLVVAKARLMAISDWSDFAYGAKQPAESGKKTTHATDPLPGIADSTGYATAAGQGGGAFLVALQQGKSMADAEAALHARVAQVVTFRGTGLNDIPSMWLKGKATVFQWDGDVRGEYFRNLGATLGAMVGSPADVLPKNLEHISSFINDLPAPPYPFKLEGTRELWTRGKEVYDANCAGCHQKDQHAMPAAFKDDIGDPLLFGLGTDVNRSKIVGPAGREAFRDALDVVCKLPDSPADACSLPREERLVTRNVGEYLAAPLDGLWARAPYLHNGSVPTLRQLLVPTTRPATFVRGSIAYDTKNVGYAWDKATTKGVVYDTSLDGLSNAGHTGTRTVAGVTYKMSWTDANDPDVEALLEYLRTL